MKKIGCFFSDIWRIFLLETRRVFTDTGVILVFFVAGTTYPLLFNLVYHDERVSDLPVAIVDESHGEGSRRFAHKLDATPEMNVAYRCNTMEEAKELMTHRKINGIVYFPADYDTRIVNRQTARIGVFADMSSFLYYKGVVMGTSYTMLDEMKQIQAERYDEAGVTGEMNDVMVTPLGYNDIKLYGAGTGGFPSFLIPALLIIVIHQTLFFGIGMLGGGARADRAEIELIPVHLRERNLYRVVLGRALAYVVVYLPLVVVDVVLLPRLFNLPNIGQPHDLACFMLPFLLATVFFSMTVSVLVKERETGILTMVFGSIVLLFLSGYAWPVENMPSFWRVLSYVFPSTHGVQGYIRINSLGARLSQVAFEYGALWLQTGLYFLTACAALAYINKKRPMQRRVTKVHAEAEARMKENIAAIRQRRAASFPQATDVDHAAPCDKT